MEPSPETELPEPVSPEPASSEPAASTTVSSEPRVALLASVFVATLLIHLGASMLQPSVGTFTKYTSAIDGLADGTVPEERLLDFSPLYLASAYVSTRLGDAIGVEAESVMEVAQRFLAAAAVSAFFWLVAVRLGRTCGLVAAAALALDSHVVVYVSILEPEILLLALLLLLVVLLERRGKSAALAAGVLAACAVATRPTFLPVFFMVPLYLWMRESPAAPLCQGGDPDHPGWKRRSAAFLVPVLLGLVALFAWAGHVSGSWRTPVMNPGTVAFEGNQPLSRGTSAIYPPLVLSMVRHSGDRPDAAHEHYRDVARAVEPEADVARVNALWSGRAKNYLLDHPGSAFQRARQKLLYALHGFDWHDIPSAWKLDRLPSMPFSLLAVAALFGLAVEARNWRRALPFYVLAAVQLGVMSAFYVSARQRLVLLPAFVYFAVCALRALTRTTRLRAVLTVLLALVLALPLALPDDAMLDEAYQRRGYLAAEPLLDQLRDDETPLAALRPGVVEAMAASPWWADWMRPAWVPQDDETLDESVADVMAARLDQAPAFLDASLRFDLADMQLRSGSLDEAEAMLEPLVAAEFRAYRGGRQPSDPRIVQARVDAARGELDAASRWLRQALDDEPGDLFALADLAALSPAGSDENRRLVETLDRYAGEADRRWLYGQALRRVGRPQEAVDELEPLSRGLPGLRDVWLQLSLSLADAGRIDDAVSALLQANRLHPEPVIEVRAFADLANRWADAHPGDVRAQLLAVRILHQHGMFRDAGRRLDQLEPLNLALSDRRQVEEIRARLAEGN